MRSRKIQFAVDPRTRPMKDRTRQAVMNLLGGTFDGAIAFDLFGGTGILAFESISRGAVGGVIFEILRNASREIQSNASLLGISNIVHVIPTDVFAWSERLVENLESLKISVQTDRPSDAGVLSSGGESELATAEESEADSENVAVGGAAVAPWVVYCCPPYALWLSEPDALRTMLAKWIELAPVGSLFAVELEEANDSDLLPDSIEWDVRLYRPAKMAIGEK